MDTSKKTQVLPVWRVLQVGCSQRGFSLVELMIVLVIAVAVLAGVTSSFRTFTRHSGMAFRENEKNAGIKATLKLLQRDLNMAGFALPSETRLAEDDQGETAIESDFTSDFDCDGNATDSTADITEACISYDLNDDGDTLDKMYRDRLFIANGWTILEDITENGNIDGDIAVSPTDYYYLVADKKEKSNGYSTALSVGRLGGATGISVDALNLNSGDEKTTADDFKQDQALILFGMDGSGSYSIEGHLVGTISGTTLHFGSGESLANNFVTTDSIVVPAITWYVDKKTGATPPDTVHWLYRDDDKVLPGVIGFQVSFGYDLNNDGLEWFPTVPPVGSVDSENSTPIVLRGLRAAKIVFTVINEGSSGVTVPTLKTYEKVILLKN